MKATNNSTQHIQLNTTASGGGTSDKKLLEINDRLTKQIEDNLELFDNLNQELTEKERALLNNQTLLQQKDREVERLMRKLNEMGENMKSLLQATKANTSTAVTTSKHTEEMERIN